MFRTQSLDTLLGVQIDRLHIRNYCRTSKWRSAHLKHIGIMNVKVTRTTPSFCHTFSSAVIMFESSLRFFMYGIHWILCIIDINVSMTGTYYYTEKKITLESVLVLYVIFYVFNGSSMYIKFIFNITQPTSICSKSTLEATELG